MPNFVIGADRVTKLMGVAIIALGGVVWADLRWQSMRAANEATEAATAAIKALDKIKEITVQHEYRLRSLEDRVSLLEGRNPLQGPPGPIRFKGRMGGPKRDVPRPPHDPPTLPDPPKEPKRRDKTERPDEPLMDADENRAGRTPAEE